MTEENSGKKNVVFKRPVQYHVTSSKFLSKCDILNSSIRKISRKNTTKIEIKNKISREEVEEELLKMKRILRRTSLYDLAMNAISHPPSDRTVELNKTISYYLRTLKNFMNILSNETEEDLEKILYDISSRLKYEKYEKNQIICKYGDKADKFYIIFKGKILFLVPKMNKHYLSEEEYIEYLLNLRKKGEIELVNKIINKNQLIFYYGEDFDEYILNSLEKYEKNKENIYSKKIYNLFYEFKKFKKNEIIKTNEIVDIEEYIKASVILSYDNPEYAKLNKKKLLTVYEYETTNIFQDGYSFGSVGASNKTNKRTATSVAYENCYLATLTKDEYLNILEKVNSKARDRIYDLVFSHKILLKMSKYTFNNKYVHMFHFIKFFKNNIILNENEKFNKLIILYKGEFTLSINKNIIELNELIVKIKKIRGKMMNISDDIIKKDLKEINENKSLLINMKYSSKDVCNIIMKKQTYIISRVNEELVLGYPNTIDPETTYPLFNCECSSNYAFGYKVEDQMLQLLEKDKYIRKNPPEIAILNVDLILERLIGFKKIMMKKINNEETNKINENNLKSMNALNSEKCKINEDDKKSEIERNSVSKKNKANSVLFDFNTKILSTSELEKTFNKQKPRTLSPLNRRLQTISNTNDINNFFSLILKLKKNILEKKNLLRKVQKQSHKLLVKEKIEMKKIQMNLNKRKSKDEYNDFSTIFAKNPHVKKTILDRIKKIKEKDNVLDPLLYNIKKQVKYSQTIDNHLMKKDINKETDYIPNESIHNLFNTYFSNTNNTYNNNFSELNPNNKPDKESNDDKHIINNNHKKMKLNNIKGKKNFSMSCDKKDFSSIYKSTDYTNSNVKSTSYSKGFNNTIINLNKVNLSKTNDNYYNNNYQDLFHMLYLKYIIDELNNKKDYKKKYGKSQEKYKTINSDNYFKNKFNINKKNEINIPLIGKRI